MQSPDLTQLLSPAVINPSGAGKAFLSVSQSCAIAVQDGADYLRNISTLSSTATGIAMTNLLITQDPSWVPIIAAAQGLVTTAATNFAAIGTAASTVMGQFRVS